MAGFDSEAMSINKESMAADAFGMRKFG